MFSSYLCFFYHAKFVIFVNLTVMIVNIITISRYGFGWESQLLETSFLAIFIVPFFVFQKFPLHHSGSYTCLFGYRWLLFRIMLGAGLIKLRGDSCWRDLSCMDYHYQTQPVPNPLSVLFHNSPTWFHQIETFTNHIVEVICPFLLFMPRSIRIAGSFIQIMFQLVLILSGNLSFLNWLTMLPGIYCFDDCCLSICFSEEMVVCAAVAESNHRKYVLGSMGGIDAADNMVEESLITPSLAAVLATMPELGDDVWDGTQSLMVTTQEYSDNIPDKLISWDDAQQAGCNCLNFGVNQDLISGNISIDDRTGEVITMEDVNQLRLRKFDKRVIRLRNSTNNQKGILTANVNTR